MADFAAWFRREDYERIREIMEDSDRLPPSFDEWELQDRLASWGTIAGAHGPDDDMRMDREIAREMANILAPFRE
jgi:hypothetical protein